MNGISKAFVRIAERCGREYGVPLPKKVLVCGDSDAGWGVKLNPTEDQIDGIESFTAHVTYNGWPCGIINPGGGGIIKVMEDTEGEIIRWAESDLQVKG